MKNMSFKDVLYKYGALIILAITFVMWLILSLSLVNLKEEKMYFWVGWAFVLVSFLISGGSFFATRLKKNITFSAVYPCYIVICGYFLVDLIMNSIFMGFGKTADPKAAAIVVPNVILLLLAVALFIVTFNAAQRIGKSNDVIDEKVRNLKRLGIEVGQIASISNSDQVKKALGKLREKIEYSDPMGTADTADAEADLEKCIGTIRTLVEENMSEDAILAKISLAYSKVDARNELLRALK